eukprot:COSAG02_NODE_32981_length_507_cov_1.019608_2_plen_86_part_01
MVMKTAHQFLKDMDECHLDTYSLGLGLPPPPPGTAVKSAGSLDRHNQRRGSKLMTRPFASGRSRITGFILAAPDPDKDEYSLENWM